MKFSWTLPSSFIVLKTTLQPAPNRNYCCVILATESSSEPKKDSTPTCQMTTEVSGTRHQRHSLIGLFTGDGHHQSKSAPTHDVMHSQVKGKIPGQIILVESQKRIPE